MNQTLKVTVRPDGSSSVEVDGVQGEACLALTADIEKAMGDVQDRKKKPTYYQKSNPGVQQKTGY